MAHNLATTNGKTAMMYLGDVPWHRLGTKLDQPATAREAIQASGLDYLVELKPLKTNDGTEVPSRKATVRTDTSDVLGVVGNGYVPGHADLTLQLLRSEPKLRKLFEERYV